MTTKLETLVSTISNSTGTPKIYAYEKKKDENNCIVYKLISTVPVKTHEGTLFEKSRIQLDVWGDTLAKSRALADKMKILLDNNVTNFKISYLSNDFTVKDIETGLFQTILEFFIW